MRILHTSDWHLGHRLHEQSQQQEQGMFLKWILEQISDREVDILMISGDIFDVSVPSTQSQRMYYDFLINLRTTGCKHIVITAGNHDAPGNIDAPKALLNALSIDVVGRAGEKMEDEVFKYNINGESVIIAAVPYLRDQDIRRAVAGESFDDITERYRSALMHHYNAAADYCHTINDTQCPQIAMGHLFAVGGKTSDSEQSIYVGSLGDIAADDFPSDFDYIALGHLHRPQIVANNPRIRYSGSPNILSFSELNYDKRVYEICISDNEITSIDDVVIPRFRDIIKTVGDLQSCKSELKSISNMQCDLLPWVEVVIDDQVNNTVGFAEIQQYVAELNSEKELLKVLKVSLKNARDTRGVEQINKHAKEVKDLSPLEIFKEKCKEQEFDLDDNEEILDAFNEIVSLIKEGR